ncbi:MAG: GFA family protein [Steroidobacteraceae bacterium]|nr:GFA family protein [Steroidobacteraceae bacterium]
MMKGSCLCGDVRFEVEGPFPWLYQCHCSLCRKQGGSVSNTGLIVAADRFRWLAGEGLVGKWQRSTGFRSHFCTRCGAPVPNPLRDTAYVWVPSGLLDGDGPLEIGAQLYVGSKASWSKLPEGVRQFEAAPALQELIATLHAKRALRG